MERLFIIFACFWISAAAAQTTDLRFGLGLTSAGASVESAYRFNDRFALRGLATGAITRSTTDTFDGSTYQLDGRLGGFGLLGDYYTGRTGFRVSGGAFVSNIALAGHTVASPRNPVQIGSTLLTNGARADVRIEFNQRVAPMLSLGYDWNFGRSFTVSGELGAIATGGLNAQISTNAPVSAADLAREERNIESQLGSFGNLYPFIGITASFRF